MTNFLLTGGLGFIGRHLTRELITRGYRPTLIVRDGQEQFVPRDAVPLTPDGLSDFVSNNVVDCVINLAGHYSLAEDFATCQKLVESNINFPLSIAVRLNEAEQVPHWIQASSFMQHMQSKRSNPSCLYAATKQSMVELLRFFENQGFTLTDVILPHVYGSNDGRMKLLESLIDAAKYATMMQLSSGTQQLDLVHVSDVIDAFLLLDKVRSGGQFQLTSSLPLTIRDLVSLINAHSPSNLNVEFDESLDRKRDTFERWIIAQPPNDWIQKIKLDEWIAEQFKLDFGNRLSE